MSELAWVRRQWDRRQTCRCGHRYRDHATGGTQCLAMVDDPDRTALIPCSCHGWTPPNPRFVKHLGPK